jgi:hypothetical protein
MQEESKSWKPAPREVLEDPNSPASQDIDDMFEEIQILMEELDRSKSMLLLIQLVFNY